MMFSFLSFLILLVLASSPAVAVSPISVRGTKLYDSDGNQFFVRGVSYLGDGDDDPLVDATQCKTDAELMKKAGINTIYVYQVDPEKGHDACMQAFANQGIYVWLVLGHFPRVTSSTQDGPQWTLSVYAEWTEVVDAFAGYDNILAFGIGQETITDTGTPTTVAPSLKAAARDLHAFSAARGYRPIPLSYSAADVPSLRQLTAQYLTCGPDADTSIDILGLNIFEGCSQSDWRTLHTEFRDLPIPVVISEAGCRTSSSGNRNRNFNDVALILSPDYQDVFSGVGVFEWRMTEDRYGLVEYEDESYKGTPQPLPQFEKLSSVLGAATPTGTPRASYTPSNVAPACPTSDAAKGWLVDEGAALPTLAALQIGTVTVSATVTNAGFPESSETGAAGQGKGQVEGDLGGKGDELSTGAIAGITVGCVVGLLALVTGVLVCLRRRRRAAAHQNHGREVVDEPPPHYTYPSFPRDEAELPAHCMVMEMDGSPSSAASWRPMWKMPMRGGRQDSPTVTELPVGKWRRTKHYELEDNRPTRADDNTQTGTWKVSPLSPAGGFV